LCGGCRICAARSSSAEATVLGETVSDFKHGIESNAVSVQVLEREIDELRGQVEDFLEQHEEQSEEAVAEVQSNGE
jgi:hypothetical protein